MVATAHCDPVTIHEAHGVVRMYSLDGEGHRAGTGGGVDRSEDVHPLDGLQTLEHPGRELVLVLGNGLHPDAIQIVSGHAEGGELSDRRGACLEAMRGLGVGANTGRAAHLVAGESHQVSSQGRHINRHLWDGLGCVDHHDGTDGMGLLGDHPDRVDRAEHVGGQGQGDDLGVLVDEALRLGLLEVETALIGDVEPPQGGSGALTHELPWHQVGVMLHHRDDDLVTGSETLTQGVGTQVESLRGVRQGHYFLGTRRPEEPRGAFTPALVCLGGLQPELVHGPSNVGVVSGVVLAQGVDDDLRFLGGVGRVKVRQRVLPHPGGQDGEILPDLLDVVAHDQELALTADTYFS